LSSATATATHGTEYLDTAGGTPPCPISSLGRGFRWVSREQSHVNRSFSGLHARKGARARSKRVWRGSFLPARESGPALFYGPAGFQRPDWGGKSVGGSGSNAGGAGRQRGRIREGHDDAATAMCEWPQRSEPIPALPTVTHRRSWVPCQRLSKPDCVGHAIPHANSPVR
jgi:hypothetical protein